MKRRSTPSAVEKPATTRIRAEPIAKSQPRTRYWMVRDGPGDEENSTLLVEMLLKPEKASYLLNMAVENGLRRDIIRDADGSDWCILEVLGEREAVHAFLVEAERIGIHRVRYWS